METNSVVHRIEPERIPRPKRPGKADSTWRTRKPEEASLGDRLRRARVEQGLTQAALQKLSGVNQKMISDVELNVAVGSVWTLTELARALHVSLDWLVGLSNNR